MIPSVTVVSLGTGDPDLLNVKTVRVLRGAKALFLRTGRHPAAEWLEKERIPFSTLDHLYETSEDFDFLNGSIASFLLEKAAGTPVVYAVPDASTDQSVRALIRQCPETAAVEVVPGVGAYDVYTSASMRYLPDAPLAVSSATDLLAGGYTDPNQTLLITELNDGILAGQVKILLSSALEDEHIVILLNGEGRAVSIPLFELDRQKGIDHRSALLVPGSGFLCRGRFVLRDLASLMERLRAPDGCPWDRMQTHESLRPYLVEEAWECVAAIDQYDPDHLCEELGDLLFQVIFHSSVADACGEFTLSDVITAICLKMIRRHPHVFGDRVCRDAGSVRTAWEQIKREETGHTSVVGSLEDVSTGLPSLKYASKILKKLNRTESSHRAPAKILSDIDDALDFIRRDPDNVSDSALGRLLLLCTELCFVRGADSELVLRQAADHLKERLKKAEKIIAKDGKSLECLTFDELCVYLRYVEGEIE